MVHWYRKKLLFWVIRTIIGLLEPSRRVRIVFPCKDYILGDIVNDGARGLLYLGKDWFLIMY